VTTWRSKLAQSQEKLKIKMQNQSLILSENWNFGFGFYLRFGAWNLGFTIKIKEQYGE
jgi:hypothetical protein